MSILVTGGGGLIGSNIVRLLIEQGREVVLYDRLPPSREGNVLADFMNRIKIEIGNVADLSHLLHVIKNNKVKGIIHCAAMITQVATEHPIEALTVNIIGSANMLEAARILELGRIVLLSSSGAMGGPDDVITPAKEELVDLPLTSIYNLTKLAEEQLVYIYRQIYKVDTIAIRPRNVYGPGERRHYTVPTSEPISDASAGKPIVRMGHGHPVPTYELVAEALAGRPIVRKTGGDAVFDLTYVKDTAKGIIQAYDCKSPNFHIYNISSGKATKMSEVCDVLKGLFPKLRIEVGPGPWDNVLSRGRQTDMNYRSMQRPPQDITRARKDFGFEPEYDIKRGITAWIRWFKEGKY